MAALIGAALFTVAQLWASQPATIGVAIIAMDIGVIVPHFAPSFETAEAWFGNHTAGFMTKAGKTVENITVWTTQPITASRMDAAIGADPIHKAHDRTRFLRDGNTVIHHAPITLEGNVYTFAPHTITPEAAQVTPSILEIRPNPTSSSRGIWKETKSAVSAKARVVTDRVIGALSLASMDSSTTGNNAYTHNTKPVTPSVHEVIEPQSLTEILSPTTTAIQSTFQGLTNHLLSSSDTTTTKTAHEQELTYVTAPSKPDSLVANAKTPSQDTIQSTGLIETAFGYLHDEMQKLVVRSRWFTAQTKLSSQEEAISNTEYIRSAMKFPRIEMQKLVQEICDQCRTLDGSIVDISCSAIITCLIITTGFFLVPLIWKLYKARLTISLWISQGLEILRPAFTLISDITIGYLQQAWAAILQTISAPLDQAQAWISGAIIEPLHRGWNAMLFLPTLVLQRLTVLLVQLRRFFGRFSLAILTKLASFGLFLQRCFRFLLAIIPRINSAIQVVRLWLGGPIYWLTQTYPRLGAIVLTGLSSLIGSYIITPILDQLWDVIALYVPALPFGEKDILKYLPDLQLESWALGRYIKHYLYQTRFGLYTLYEAIRTNLLHTIVKLGRDCSVFFVMIFAIIRYILRAAVNRASDYKGSIVKAVVDASHTVRGTITTKAATDLRFLSPVFRTMYSIFSGVGSFVLILIWSIIRWPFLLLLRQLNLVLCQKLVLCGTQTCSIGWQCLVLIPYLASCTTFLILAPYFIQTTWPNVWPSAIGAAALLAYTVYRRKCPQDNIIIFAKLLFWFLVWWFSRRISQLFAFIDGYFDGKPGRYVSKKSHGTLQWLIGIPEASVPVADITSPQVQGGCTTVIDDEKAAAESALAHQQAVERQAELDRRVAEQVALDARDLTSIEEVDDFEPYVPPHRSVPARKWSKPVHSDPLDYIPYFSSPESTPPKAETKGTTRSEDAGTGVQGDSQIPPKYLTTQQTWEQSHLQMFQLI